MKGRQFFEIFKFEFKNYAKSKVFIVLTVALVVLIAGVLTLPNLLSGLPQTQAEPEKAAVLNDNGLSALYNAIPAENRAYELVPVDLTEAELEEKVLAGEYACGIVLTGDLSYRYVVPTVSLYDDLSAVLNSLLVSSYQAAQMAQGGLTADQIAAIMGATAEAEVVNLGKDQTQNILYTYILLMALYMAIMLYGQLVASSVAAEKSSRAMELLITTAKPVNLMFGKIIGTGLCGLIQIVCLVGSGFLFYRLNYSYWQDNALMASIFGMPAEMLLYTVLFFVLGYFLYAFLYGALGSLANRSEDVNTLSMPVTFLFLIGFFVVLFSMMGDGVDSGLMKFCSYFPFTSPMAMFCRVAMGNVPLWGVILSVVLLLAATVLVGLLCSAVYRLGVLLYGKPPKPGELIRMLKNQKKEARMDPADPSGRA